MADIAGEILFGLAMVTAGFSRTNMLSHKTEKSQRDLFLPTINRSIGAVQTKKAPLFSGAQFSFNHMAIISASKHHQ
ncbi:hypothetical protein [Parasphingorhabdus sp.]|uniref:hypothetical protein n=1 Tax=Parasphingorhabdus sp. TaxID=2709688 RepID=UPI003BB0C6C0